MATKQRKKQMKELHQAYGEIVYQAEIEQIIPRTAVDEMRQQLINQYGTTITGLLGDIYDDVTDYPELWAGYAA
jgi:hypothetical protein